MAHPLLSLVLAPDEKERESRPWDARAHTLAPEDRDRATAGLVRRIREGDVSAFEHIVREYFTPLSRFAFGFVRSYDAAEDIAQGVLCRLWERRETWAPNAGVRAYLFAAARNAALNIRAHSDVRARTYESMREMFVEPAERIGDSPDHDTELQEALDRLREATAKLSERQRLAVHLRYEQEMTIPEVAHVLGVSSRATERLLARALTTLRDAMARRD